uniref:PYD and CARD domain containing n=1 Tax=Xenopus tropicalis TaxID=8364 RepID=A0A6I8SK41_XENTR
MAQTPWDKLVFTLENLPQERFKRFKEKLNKLEVDSYKPIPWSQLQDKDAGDVANRIISNYTESVGINVALRVLHSIGEKEACQDLAKALGIAASTPPVKPGADSQRVTPTDGQHFVDRHRAALIARVSLIDPVLDELLGDGTLTQEQYDTVRSKGTCQERMRQLYDCVRAWGKIEKDKFYQYLLEENGPLVRDLENN